MQIQTYLNVTVSRRDYLVLSTQLTGYHAANCASSTGAAHVFTKLGLAARHAADAHTAAGFQFSTFSVQLFGGGRCTEHSA